MTLAPEHVVVATLVGSLVLFLSDALRYDAVAILVALVLAVTGALSAEEAFAGFASPAVVLVASMYAFATAVARTGVTEEIGRRLLPAGEETGEAVLVFRVVLVSGLLSSVLSNAAVVATLIPVLGAVAAKARLPVSRLLIPLSYGSLLGGLLTVIGTSKNIVVNGLLEQAGVAPFGLFDFTLYGGVLLVVGALFFLGPGRRLLPRHRVEETLTEHYQVPKFVTEVLVEPSSHLINRSVADVEVFERYGISVLGLVRAQGEGTLLAPGPYNRIRGDDVLILQGEPEAIVRMREDLDLRQRDSVRAGDTNLVSGDVQLAEAVVPGISSLVGRTLKEADFYASTGLNVLAISKFGDVRPTKLGAIPLEVGDTLLVQGHRRDLGRMVRSRELVLLGVHDHQQRMGGKAWVTLGLLVLVLLGSSIGGVHLSVAALAGATALVLLRCLRADDVRRGMDWSVLILIGGMLALGKAFEKHGLDQVVAGWLQDGAIGLDHPLAVAGTVFAATLGLTQLVNHVAAAAIMTPIALSLARSMGVDHRAMIMAVLTGAEFAFMSPIAHQANAMVMGPGDYRYRDFLRVGTPLTLLLGVVALALLPLFFGI